MVIGTHKHGFTIVELLIVIVVIAILASISVVAYNGVQDRARRSAASSDLSLLHKAILAGRINENKTLFEITGFGNTCNTGDQARYELSLDRISAASGMSLAPLKQGDPWGNSYCIQENEAEFSHDICRTDWIEVRNSSPLIRTVLPMYLPQCH